MNQNLPTPVQNVSHILHSISLPQSILRVLNESLCEQNIHAKNSIVYFFPSRPQARQWLV